MSGKVLVYITTYNQDKYVKECVYSVIKQSYSPLEIIVIDDHSTDRTPEILGQFKADPNTHIISPPNELGRDGKCMNYAFAWAEGQGITSEYEMKVDGDNELKPGAIEKLAGCLSNADFAYSYYTRDILGAISPGWTPETFTPADLLAHYELGPSVLWRTSLRKKIGGFCGHDDRWNVDWDFALRAYEAGARFSHLKEELFYYRWHSGNVSSRNGAKEQERLDALTRQDALERSRVYDKTAGK